MGRFPWKYSPERVIVSEIKLVAGIIIQIKFMYSFSLSFGTDHSDNTLSSHPRAYESRS